MIRTKFKGIFIIIILILILILINPVKAEIINITVSEDSYINASANSTNYGNADHMRTFHGTDGRYGFLKFDVPEYTEKAYLYVYTNGGWKTANYYSQVRVASNDWNENGIMWDNKPKFVDMNQAVDSVYVSSNNQWVVFNVSSAIQSPGTYSFRLQDRYGYNAEWISKEGAEGYAPYLELHTIQYTDTTLNNKTNDDSKTFLVSTGETICFTLNTDNLASCLWSVNKTDQLGTSNTFVFTVPSFDPENPTTGIWEIRVEGTHTNNSTVIREWLISGLTEEQAPNFIDYFTTLDNGCQPFKDPWGRPFPMYVGANANLIADGYLTGTTTSPANYLSTLNNFPIQYGTYIFKVKNDLNNSPIDNMEFNVGNRFCLRYAIGEYHDYFSVLGVAGYTPISRNWMGQAPGNQHWTEKNWREVKVISTPDGWWYLYRDGVLNPRAIGNFDNPNLPGPLSLIANSQIRLDCVEAYENRYLFPPTNITYGSYPKLWYQVSDSNAIPVNHNGIIIDGRNITLQQISETLNNKSIMTYNTETKTAIMKTNFFLKAGAEINIKNESFLFDTSIEPLFVRPDSGSTITIQNSTISTTANNPLIWTFVSPYAQTVFDPVLNSITPTENSLRRPIYNWRGRLIIEDSTINNSCNMFLQAPHELILNNTIFSNMSGSDDGVLAYMGGYDGTPGDRGKIIQARGKKSIRIVPAIDLANFSVNNISFVNPKEPITLENVGGQWIFNETVIENSDLSNIAITTKKAHKQEYHQNYKLNDEKGNLSLLNCLVDESSINVITENATLKTKYYADVVVRDAAGNPVQNAVIISSASNESHRAENLYKYERYEIYGPGEGGVTGYESYPVDHPYNQHNFNYRGGDFVKWDNCLALGSAITNAAGRTALPAEDVNNSIVLTHKVFTNETGIQSIESIKYNLTINSPNSKSFYIQDLDPDPNWYRKNPSLSEYTITAIIPDDSKGPHITGFAPSTDNPFNPGEKKNFRIWTDEPLTSMEWLVNGSSVLKGSLNYTWTVTDRNTTIEFIGSNADGPVNHKWDLGESSNGTSGNDSIDDEIPEQEVIFSPADSVITLNVSEKTVFSVSPNIFTTKEWYIDGYPIQNNTTSMTRCWSTAGTHDVTFKGAGSGEPVSHTWTVNVVEEKKNDEESTESIIAIAPEYQIVKPKQSFGLDITVDPSAPIIGTQLDFEFNSSMASANSVIEGDLFKQKGASTFFNEGDINSSGGTIKHIYGLIIGTSNVSSPGTFATVNLTAGNRTGIAKFSLSNVLISDINSKSVPYTVTNATVLIDTAPAIDPVCCPKSVDEKSNLAFKISAKDADGDRLTLSASGLPEGASFNRTSGAFAWTPAVGQAGVYTVTFKVSDGYLTDSENVTVTVNKLNNPPVINFFEPINGSSFSEGERIGISVNATDAEKQALNYSIKIDGVMYSSDPAYVWETDYSSSGNHTIEVSVSDRIDEIKRQHTIYISECHPRWDVNEDGVVNILDITNVSREYETTVSKPYPRYDTNQDGEINILDLTLVGHHFGELVT